MSGLTTVATPKTEPSGPRNLPRSRGGTRSATTACDRIISPAAPRPCRARARTSWTMSWAAPHSTDATRKTTIDPSSSDLRPRASPSFPKTGIATAAASA